MFLGGREFFSLCEMVVAILTQGVWARRRGEGWGGKGSVWLVECGGRVGGGSYHRGGTEELTCGGSIFQAKNRKAEALK